MRIALTGASGFIGSKIARSVAESGHQVTALVRSTSRRDHIEPWIDRFVEAPHDDETAWDALLDDADCLVHNSVDWAPLKTGDAEAHLQSNLVASLRLLRKAEPRQIVFMSTIAVHHDMRPRFNGVIDEDHPTRPGNDYGAYKAAVEAYLWSAHFSRGVSACALRPCGVYGMDPALSRSIGYPIVEKILARGKFTKKGGGKFVHVDDVALATAGTIGNPDAAGKVYNLVDCYARWSDLARMAAEILEVEIEVDESSPATPRNEFDCAAARSLGAKLDRGHAGLRQHLEELIGAMQPGSV